MRAYVRACVRGSVGACVRVRVKLTRFSNARWPLVLSSNIIGMGYNGVSHIDEVRLFATTSLQCHFDHSIGVNFVVRRLITSEI